MSLGRLIFGDGGSIEGICAFCGYTKSDEFYEFSEVVSDNFVYYNKIKGKKICDKCYRVFKDQRFRYSSFVATSGKVEFLKPKEILNFLYNPVYPNFIYLTKTFKKQGWVDGFEKVSISPEFFYIHTDFVGCIQVDYQEFMNVLRKFQKLVEAKIPKTSIVVEETISSYRKVLESGLETEFSEVKKYRNTGILEVLAYVV